ncbi:tetratricopeptide repeat protein [Merismopedia glauca]|uniref:Uncharacterized protein n=1 Tax=Merismopedia glauca CCAP 1448/3 TaxID=1296344 RepID=A0A2T1C9V6_9CYAN|nr:tetratricopeptide repeat protein [Merismopedia glauca]PSB05050.1 hypothetical protein C7B64_01435 [Merismopedia glauca CCAP 1448/3]
MSTKPLKASKTFKILSIGQRGVGKTVFLAGSHLELQGSSASDRIRERRKHDSADLWFECENKEAEENLAKIVRYIESSGEYPPPTMKITDFSFNLCQRTFSSSKKLCNFIWSDIPGEICENSDREFHQMVYASHGCCAFIDLQALIEQGSYADKLSSIMEQVTVIANLTRLNNLSYPFSIILTKCDLLSADPTTRAKVETELESIAKRLHTLGINYQVFFSFIPITKTVEQVTVKPQGAAAALLWLVAELERTYKRSLTQYMSTLESGEIEKISTGSLQSVFHQSRAKRGSYSLFTARHQVIVPAAIASGLALVVGLIAFKPDLLPNEGNTSQAQIEQRQLKESISYLEKLAEAEPDQLEWKLRLAKLYQSTGDYVKSEQMYDRIIAKQENHITALVNKAIIRQQQGDRQTAAALFSKAEQVAPNEQVKAEIRNLAQKNLANGQ